MTEILSKSCCDNEEISFISTCNCYFEFCFYFAENSFDFTKKKFPECYYFYYLGHLTITCFKISDTDAYFSTRKWL